VMMAVAVVMVPMMEMPMTIPSPPPGAVPGAVVVRIPRVVAGVVRVPVAAVQSRRTGSRSRNHDPTIGLRGAAGPERDSCARQHGKDCPSHDETLRCGPALRAAAPVSSAGSSNGFRLSHGPSGQVFRRYNACRIGTCAKRGPGVRLVVGERENAQNCNL